MTLLPGLSAARNPLAAAAASMEVIPGDYRIGGVLLSVAAFLGGVHTSHSNPYTRTKHPCCLGCVHVDTRTLGTLIVHTVLSTSVGGVP